MHAQSEQQAMNAGPAPHGKPIGAKPHLIALFLQVSILWFACFIFQRDGFFYILSAFCAIAVTLKRQDVRSTVMPGWLSVALWVPACSFLLLLAFVAIRHFLVVEGGPGAWNPDLALVARWALLWLLLLGAATWWVTARVRRTRKAIPPITLANCIKLVPVEALAAFIVYKWAIALSEGGILLSCRSRFCGDHWVSMHDRPFAFWLFFTFAFLTTLFIAFLATGMIALEVDRRRRSSVSPP